MVWDDGQVLVYEGIGERRRGQKLKEILQQARVLRLARLPEQKRGNMRLSGDR